MARTTIVKKESWSVRSVPKRCDIAPTVSDTREIRMYVLHVYVTYL